MKRIHAGVLALLILSLPTFAFGQGGFFATVTGTVTDWRNHLWEVRRPCPARPIASELL